MGFRLNRIYDLRFSGILAGMEVRIRSTPVAAILGLMEGGVDEGVDLLVQYVESWNLECADGSPLPIEADTIKRELEKAIIVAICTAWYRTATQVPIPLDDESTSGASSLAVSIPTEML